MSEQREKKSLLMKYELPVDHLSFEYVEKCNDRAELVRIVKILRSGEEGNYPDLMKCAETRLQQIAPQSRILKTEEPLLTKTMMEPEQWNEVISEIKEWSGEMKLREKGLEEVTTVQQSVSDLPAVRKVKSNVEKPCINTQQAKVKSVVPRNYAEWDKFDADKEILKMELEDERRREEQAAKKKKQHQKEKKEKTVPVNQIEYHMNFSTMEKEFLATQEKDRGNECYRAGEYEQAVKHYSSSIELNATPAAYNNRAMAQLKLNKYGAALGDCNRVLEAEPLNVKALMRRGIAHQNKNNYEKALEDFSKVVDLEPDNQLAKSRAEQMRKKCEPSLKSVRMTIDDEPESGGFVFPKPRPNVPVNEWGLAKVMCRCNGTPSWVYKKPPKCKICQRKRAERRAKREEEKKKINEVSRECSVAEERGDTNADNTTASSIVRDSGGTDENTKFYHMQTDEKGAGDMRTTEKVLEEADATKSPEFPNLENLKTSDQESNKECENTEKSKEKTSSQEDSLKTSDTNSDNVIGREGMEECFKVSDERNEKPVCESYQNVLITDDSTTIDENSKTVISETSLDSDKGNASVRISSNSSSSSEIKLSEQAIAMKTEEKTSSRAVHNNSKQIAILADSSGVKRKVKVATKYMKNVKTAKEEESQRTRQCYVPLRDVTITSPYEFVKIWEALKVDSDLSAYAQVLRAIPPSNLHAVVSNKLDGPMLSIFLKCLEKTYFTPELTLEYLNNIIALPRFNIVSLFLETPEKQAVCHLLKRLDDQGLQPSGALWKAFTY